MAIFGQKMAFFVIFRGDLMPAGASLWKVQTGACITACLASHIDFVLTNQPYQDDIMAKKDKLALTKIWFNQLLLSLPKSNITKTIDLAEGSGYHNNGENDTPVSTPQSPHPSPQTKKK